MFVTFVILVGALATSLAGPRVRRRWQIGAVVVSVAAVASAAVIGVATEGAVWGFPLAGLVWSFGGLNLVPVSAAGGFGRATRDPGLRDWSLVRAARQSGQRHCPVGGCPGLHRRTAPCRRLGRQAPHCDPGLGT